MRMNWWCTHLVWMDVIDTLMIYGQDQVDFSGGTDTTIIRTPNKTSVPFVAKKEYQLDSRSPSCSHTAIFSFGRHYFKL